jgi:O-antigen ligase
MAVVSTPAAANPIGEPQAQGLGWVFGIAGLALMGALMGFGLVFGELEALFISLSVIACLAVLYDFRIGAVLLIVLLPLSDSNIFPHALLGVTGLNPLNLLIGATLVSYLVRGRLQPAGPAVSPRLVWLYIVPLAIAGILGSRHVGEIPGFFYDTMVIHFLDAPGYLRDLLAKPLLTVVIAVLVGAAVARSKKPEGFLIAIGVSVWLICLLSIWYVVRSGTSIAELSSTGSREFFSAIGLHANSIGRLYAVAYALLLFAWAESSDRKFKLACLATMGVIVVALMLTFSRGAFIGFIIVNALFLLWRVNAKTWAIVLLGGTALILMLPAEVFDRMALGFDQDANAVTAGRLDGIWLPVLPELWRSPIWGNGLGSVMWSDAMHKGLMLEVIHPHNAYLEALLDIGVAGLVVVLAYFAHVWRNFRSLGSNAFLSPEMRGFYQGAAAGLLGFLVTGFAGSSLAPLPEQAFLWMAIGMMYGQLARRPAAG